VVYLAVPTDRLTQEPWIQIEDPDVAFARMFEPVNWSAALGHTGSSIIGCECYCSATSTDPVWSLDDEALGRRCADALVAPLGLIGRSDDASLVEVVRMARAYPVASVDELELASRPAQWLAAVTGIEIAQGGAVIEAIDAGEAAGERILAQR
jgi:protoporphyrinogen oxidase